MTAFTPATTEHLDPPGRPDDVTRAAVDSLRRPTGHRLAYTTVKTLLVGGLTGGLGPLVFLPVKFRKYAAVEQQQYRHAADWLALRSGDAEAVETLRESAARTGFSTSLAAVTYACVAVAVGLAALFVSRGDRLHGFDDLLAFVYLPAGRGLGALDDVLGINAPLRLGYLAAVAAGYFAHLWQVNRHARAVGQFLDTYDAATAGDGSPAGLDRRAAATPLRRPGFQIGLRAGPVVGGLVLAVAGVLWGVPMVLASGAQARYVWGAGPRARRSLSARLRATAEADRPAVDLPRRIFDDALACPNPQCRAAVPPDGAFCPRCGTRVARPVARYA